MKLAQLLAESTNPRSPNYKETIQDSLSDKYDGTIAKIHDPAAYFYDSEGNEITVDFTFKVECQPVVKNNEVNWEASTSRFINPKIKYEGKSYSLDHFLKLNDNKHYNSHYIDKKKIKKYIEEFLADQKSIKKFTNLPNLPDLSNKP